MYIYKKKKYSLSKKKLFLRKGPQPYKKSTSE